MKEKRKRKQERKEVVTNEKEERRKRKKEEKGRRRKNEPPVNSSFDMNGKNIPVEFEEAKGEILFHFFPENRIVFITADAKPVTLQFQVNRRVVVPGIRHILYSCIPEGRSVG